MAICYNIAFESLLGGQFSSSTQLRIKAHEIPSFRYVLADFWLFFLGGGGGGEGTFGCPLHFCTVTCTCIYMHIVGMDRRSSTSNNIFRVEER